MNENEQNDEKQFLKLVANIPGVSYRCLWDKKWTMQFISPEVENLSGYPVTDFIDNAVRSYASLLHPDDQTRVGRDIVKAVTDKVPYALEYRIVRADGTNRWVYERGQAIRDDEGTVRYLDGVIIDITERRRTERIIESIYERTASVTGNTFFRELSHQLGEMLNVKYAFVGKLNSGDTVQTLAVWAINEFADNFSYSLTGTPCKNVRETGTCFYPDRVVEQFPDDHLLADMGVESYMGIPLKDSAGEPIGILVVLDSEPMEEIPPLRTVMEAFAQRASAEMERRNNEEALKESETRLKQAQTMALLGSYSVDLETNRTIWSDEMKRLLWCSDEEPTYEFYVSRIHPDDRQQVLERQQRLSESGDLGDEEYRVVGPDGTIRWVRNRVEMERDADGRAIRMMGVHQDITASKLADEALRDSESRNRAILEAMPDLMFCLTPLGVHMSFYSSDKKKLFADPGEIIGRSLKDVLPEDVAELYMTRITETLEDGGVHIFEYSLEFPESDQKHFEARMVPQSDGNVLTLVRDITEEKTARAAKVEFDARSTAIIENVVDGVITIDTTGIIEDVNPAVLRMFDYEMDELIGKNIKVLVPEPFKRQHDEYIAEFIRTGKKGFIGSTREVVGQRKDGSTFPARITVSEIVFGENRLFSGLVHDLSHEYELERQLNQAQKLESIGRLAGGVAHDFNNMLSVILGHSELAMSRIDESAPNYEALKEIENAAKKSADLTRQLLAFAREQTVSPKVLELNSITSGMTSMLKRLIGEDVELAWEPGGETWPIKIDPSQIDQILANLCINARDSILGVGKISILTENVTIGAVANNGHPGVDPGDYVSLAVCDTGTGMDEETVAHAFEPFFTTKEKNKGTGLGLATVYGIVRQNQGSIKITSELGAGTTVRILLPRHLGKTESEKVDDIVQVSSKGKETILLVEDERAILKLTKIMLERFGYHVVTASTPADAITSAKKFSGEIHLLMTDVVMPEMNGLDLAEEVVSLYPNIKKLFVSGYTADIIADHGVLDDGIQFLQKPFTSDKLAAKIQLVLSQSSVA
jgi:PAS domain S-box-containing protein